MWYFLNMFLCLVCAEALAQLASHIVPHFVIGMALVAGVSFLDQDTTCWTPCCFSLVGVDYMSLDHVDLYSCCLLKINH